MQRYEFQAPLDLQKTLFCGQCFHWRQINTNTYRGTVNGTLYTAVQTAPLQVRFEAEDESDLAPVIALFDGYRDYAPLTQKFCQNPLLARAVEQGTGLRLMNIGPWEAMCSFILSQNNNVSRITGLVQNLCKLYGDPLSDDFYTFPSPQKLANLTAEDLAPLKAGFRAKYLIDAAKKVSSGVVDLSSLHKHRDAFVRKKLMQINGIGPKVADCILLFGYGRVRTVPMDVWMKRVLQTGFGGKWPRCTAGAEGLAQQFLFDFARHNPNIFKNG